MVKSLQFMKYQDNNVIQYCFLVFYIVEFSNGIICVLEMSYMVMDGVFMDFLFCDFGCSYEGILNGFLKLFFSFFVFSFQQCDLDEDMVFWKYYFEGVEFCYFLVLIDGFVILDYQKEFCLFCILFFEFSFL